ncbi:MAG: hypothetical protein SFV18_04035 [Bryobacteraceae bacterium]|jgi:mono/diheme cytochrome c family protein|nr:hypothetical protein [Bryobacteraceae bacterium]
MNKPLLCGLIVGGLFSAGAILIADELHEPMEKVGKANGMIRKGAGAGDMKAVSDGAAMLIEVLPTTVAAWEKRNMADAVGWTKEGIGHAKDLKAAADANNADGVRAAMSKLGGTCKSCHTAHREEIPGTDPKKYKIK